MPKREVDDPRPQYIQVVEHIRSEIADEEPRPRVRLPSHAEVAADCGVSVGTVKRAFGLLQDEGLIISRQGQLAHVRAQPGRRPPVTPADEEGRLEVNAALADLDRRLSEVQRRLSDAGR